MDELLSLPFWRLKPYVRPIPIKEAKKRKATSLDESKKRKLEKQNRVKKYHQKALNKVYKL